MKSQVTYGKYVYTNIGKDSFKINNEEYKLDRVNSSILKLGAEMKHNLSNTFGLYYGLAYNYEFAGRARGKVEGLKIRKADISGSSGRIRTKRKTIKRKFLGL